MWVTHTSTAALAKPYVQRQKRKLAGTQTRSDKRSGLLGHQYYTEDFEAAFT